MAASAGEQEPRLAEAFQAPCTAAPGGVGLWALVVQAPAPQGRCSRTAGGVGLMVAEAMAAPAAGRGGSAPRPPWAAPLPQPAAVGRRRGRSSPPCPRVTDNAGIALAGPRGLAAGYSNSSRPIVRRRSRRRTLGRRFAPWLLIGPPSGAASCYIRGRLFLKYGAEDGKRQQPHEGALYDGPHHANARHGHDRRHLHDRALGRPCLPY